MPISGRGLLRIALGLTFVSPYLIWATRARPGPFPLAALYQVVSYAVPQAALSALAAFGVGVVLMSGLLTARRRAVAEFLLLAPSLVPALLLVLSLLGWFPLRGGLLAVVLVHAWLNAGLVAVALARLIEVKLGDHAAVAWTLSVSRAQFWVRVAWPLIRAEALAILLFVFSLCLVSFSIPLLLGGPRALSFEIAIYNAIRAGGDWGQALWLAAAQSFGVLLLAGLVPRARVVASTRARALNMYGVRAARSLIGVPFALLALGWLGNLGSGALPIETRAELVPAALMSLSLGLAVGLIHLILFISTAFVLPHERLARFLRGVLSTGSALTAFAFLLVAGPAFFRTALALSLISYPLLFRWQVDAALAGVHAQIQVARSLGASWSAILFEIVMPQAGSSLFRASGLAAVWASGDFAVSGILLPASSTLPLHAQELLARYQYAAAGVLVLPLLLTAAFVYTFFAGASRYVCR